MVILASEMSTQESHIIISVIYIKYKDITLLVRIYKLI